MSHNTTSWKSHRRTWRWTAGNDGRTPEGEKARRGGGRPPLAGQKALRQHDAGKVSMHAVPAPVLVVIQSTRALSVLVERLDRPAAVRQLGQPVQRRVHRQVAKGPREIAAFARHRAFAEQPALWARADAGMAGGAFGSAGGPVHPHGHALFAEDHIVVLAPGEGLPAVLRQGCEDDLGRIPQRWARLLRLATPARTRRQRGTAAGTSAGRRTPKVRLIPTT